ncbi:hypothetical protein GCM10010331_03570 [Streptomyces xanthochromogenes]|nr:hypothetical protein GCM10010331_03570 [Streptomyces xanthochromogenes]
MRKHPPTPVRAENHRSRVYEFNRGPCGAGRAVPRAPNGARAGHAPQRPGIVAIRDVTPLAHRVHALVRDGQLDAARALLPAERVYPAADDRSAAAVRPGS